MVQQPELFPQPSQPEQTPVDLDAIAAEIARVASTDRHKRLVTQAYARDTVREGLFDFAYPEFASEVGAVATDDVVEMPADLKNMANRHRAKEAADPANRLAAKQRERYSKPEDQWFDDIRS